MNSLIIILGSREKERGFSFSQAHPLKKYRASRIPEREKAITVAIFSSSSPEMIFSKSFLHNLKFFFIQNFPDLFIEPHIGSVFDLNYLFSFIGKFKQADLSVFLISLCFQQTFFHHFRNHVAGRGFADLHGLCQFGDRGIAQEINFFEIEEDIAGDIIVFL